MPIQPSATLNLGASNSSAGFCEGCGSALMLGHRRGRGRPRRYCIRCRELHRAAVRLRQARGVLDGLRLADLVADLVALLRRVEP